MAGALLDAGAEPHRLEGVVEGAGRGLVLARLQLGAIFQRKNVFALQVFGSVNVLGLFLQALFAGAFLARCFTNTWVLLSLVLSLS